MERQPIDELRLIRWRERLNELMLELRDFNTETHWYSGGPNSVSIPALRSYIIDAGKDIHHAQRIVDGLLEHERRQQKEERTHE